MLKNCRKFFKKIMPLAVGIFILSSGKNIFAARPFLTEDAPTTPAGAVGLEFGTDFKDPVGDISANIVGYAGVCDSLEVFAEVPTVLKSGTPDVAGKIEVFNLGCKWNFYKSGEEQILTLAANVSNLPNESSKLAYGAALVFSKSAGADIAVSANFGGNFSSEKFESYLWGVGAEKPISDKLTLCGEIHSADTLFDKAFNDNHVTAMGGIRWALSEKAWLDLSLRLPLTDEARALNDDNEPTERAHYVVGLTYEF